MCAKCFIRKKNFGTLSSLVQLSGLSASLKITATAECQCQLIVSPKGIGNACEYCTLVNKLLAMFSTVGAAKDVAMEDPPVVMAVTLLLGRLRHDWFTEPSKLRLDCDRLAIEKSEAAMKRNGFNRSHYMLKQMSPTM